MPIFINERPEVFTDAALSSSEPPLLIRSKAMALLTHELRRYCKREVSGRSFLIAGHRGAGKTTLVLSACQEIFNDSKDGRVFLRPLVIMLQGPNLLPNEDDELPVAEDADKTKIAQKKITPMENVLRQITLGLYGALAREVAQAFRRHAIAPASTSNSALAARPGELIEFAAALELELDEYPGKARLRRFWEKAGVLETGVLRLTPRPLGEGASTTKSGRRPDQGLRELVALCSACEAYRRISGTFTSKQEDKHGAKATNERKTEWDVKGKDVLGPLVPVLAGTLAGAGLWTTEATTGLPAVFAAVAVAIGSAFAIKYSVGRWHERSATREDLFIPDLSVATLDRVLPVLIERLRDAGLAPIFVIDELDKVERLSVRIPEMVRRLKKLVAENAFFCFLTDRTYYEQMRKREAKNPYSIEHTYFTHQLFIIFRHRDLHLFLKEVLQPPPDTLPETQQVSTGAPSERDAQNQTKVERDDADVLPHLLLYAARMHSIDLRRELLQIRDDKGNVNLPPGAPQGSRRYSLELQMQVAIETLLNEEDMERELDRHPEFRRLAHDALYYLATRWEDADVTLDLRDREHLGVRGGVSQRRGNDGPKDEEPLSIFKKYLYSRMATDPSDNTNSDVASDWHHVRSIPPARENGVTVTDESENDPPVITPADLNFLWARVRDLAVLLSSPEALLAKARLAPATPEVILKAVSLDPLLAKLEGKEHSYHWCWYPSGRRIQKTHAPAWQQHRDFIRAFEKALSALTNKGVSFADLGASVNIISTSPPWKIVEEAIKRLETLARDAPYADQDDDADKVAKFDALLKRSSATIAYALCAAGVLRLWRKSKAVGNRGRHSLATISYVLSLRDASEANVGKWMKEIFEQIRSRYATSDSSSPPSLANIAGIELWKKWVRTERARAQVALRSKVSKDLPAIRKGAWSHWYARLSGNDFDIVNLDSLICARGETGPWSYLTLPIEDMTIRAWSDNFFSVFKVGVAPVIDERPPPWLAVAALSHLGFRDRVATLLKLDRGDIKQLFRNLKLPLPRFQFKTIEKWSLDQTLAPSVRSVIALRRGDRATIEAWKPDRAFPILALSRSQIEALAAERERLTYLKRLLYPDVVVFDLTSAVANESTSAITGRPLPVADDVEKLFWEMVSPRPVMPLGIPVVLPAEVAPLGIDYLPVVNPTNSEDLFRQLVQQEEMARNRVSNSPSPSAT